MSFLESYKHLEKLCGDMYNTQYGVSAYIRDMESKPRGSYKIFGWDTDLKRLKHLQWVRNQITHEPGCTEQNMCGSQDAEWLDGFYDRIMNQTDPLTLYRKAVSPKPVKRASGAYTPAQRGDGCQNESYTPARRDDNRQSELPEKKSRVWIPLAAVAAMLYIIAFLIVFAR